MSYGIYIFQEKPDWRKGVKVSMTYASQISLNMFSAEQRAGMREKPRLGIEYTISNKPNSYWRRTLSEALRTRVGVPLWTAPIQLTKDGSNAKKGNGTFNPAWLKVNGYIAIPSQQRIAQVLQIGTGYVVLDTNADTGTWYPLIVGTFDQGIQQHKVESLGKVTRTIRVEEL